MRDLRGQDGVFWSGESREVSVSRYDCVTLTDLIYRQYFIDMGYTPANRQSTADFLTAVTDPLARIPRADALTLPRTAQEFATFFKESDIGRSNTNAVELYLEGHTEINEKAYQESARAERALSSRKARFVVYSYR